MKQELRKLLTQEEKSKLNFSYLDYDSKERCIYGQTTGNCNSERAKELIKKACKKFL